MNKTNHTRRTFVAASSGLLAGAMTVYPMSAASGGNVVSTHLDATSLNLRYCLNTSTINGSKVPIREQLRIASQAGYDAVELWLRDVQKFIDEGGKLSDLAREISDLGLGVDSAIAFGNWIVDDEQQRLAGLDQCKRDMEIVHAIGGRYLAAPPVGATKQAGLDLAAAANRYRALLELGAAVGVIPQLELWGFSQNVSTLAEVLYIAAAAKHPNACILLDVYHMYKGGDDFNNVGLIPAQKMHCLHMNDYPAVPGRAKIQDADRVFPGDGIAPIQDILRTLLAGGFCGTLSLELFNRNYWQRPATEVAIEGIDKMKRCVGQAVS